MSPFSSDESPVAAARRCGRRFCTPNAVFGAASATIRYEGRGVVLLFGPGNFPFSLVFKRWLHSSLRYQSSIAYATQYRNEVASTPEVA